MFGHVWRACPRSLTHWFPIPSPSGVVQCCRRLRWTDVEFKPDGTLGAFFCSRCWGVETGGALLVNVRLAGLFAPIVMVSRRPLFHLPPAHGDLRPGLRSRPSPPVLASANFCGRLRSAFCVFVICGGHGRKERTSKQTNDTKK